MSDQQRIVEARQKLRERFLARMKATPSMADEKRQATGPANRHGMPKLPVGQTATAPGKWPVLDLGNQPDVSPASWQLRVDGACEHPTALDWAAFNALPQVDDTSDFH